MQAQSTIIIGTLNLLYCLQYAIPTTGKTSAFYTYFNLNNNKAQYIPRQCAQDLGPSNTNAIHAIIYIDSGFSTSIAELKAGIPMEECSGPHGFMRE